MSREVAIQGKSQSTLDNYTRHLAHLVLHFHCSPTELDEEQLKDYLHLIKQEGRSASFFKFTIYGLRMLFRSYGLDELRVAMPSIKGDDRLPVVFSQQEIKRLLSAPDLLKHRLMLALLYGCGLRNAELRAIRLEHIDTDRRCLHVVQGKGGKDRMVPLCDLLIRGIQDYIGSEHPRVYLFNGKSPQDGPEQLGGPVSGSSVRWVLAQAVQKTGITKAVNVHSLRHSYATHLLEMGLDIVSIKELMGHQSIQTTMVYLQVAQMGRSRSFSPLSKLYPQQG